ncbi:MAG TPA: adenine deaminase C-terminal domain-containing protein [Candidatus Acidoferrales bacterium]|jgi:adenine deaminase|nr:adenine deaminase C-terminal domain-containing protein [Candidatus Acidoferrales bacterium]
MIGRADEFANSMISLLLKNCRLLNVYSGEIYPTDIAISGDRVISTSRQPYDDSVRAEQVIDCAGKFAIPGMIDGHMHVDTTFLWPGELARILVPLGTTTLFVDTTNIAHTGGVAAIEALRQSFEGLPLRAYFAAPSYCPFDAQLETAATEMNSGDIQTLLNSGCVSIGETVFSKIARGDSDYLRGVDITRVHGARVSGHGGEISRGDEAAFDAYVAAGINDDHCVGRAEDMLPRLRRNLKLFSVECSGRRGQLKPLLQHALAQRIPLREICLCVDNITVMDIVADGYGYLDYLVRVALDLGIAPVDAFRMVSLNPAEHYRLSGEIGGIAPGRKADILLMRSPDAFPPDLVVVDGRVAAENGRLTAATPAPSIPEFYSDSIHLDRVTQKSLSIAAPPGASRIRVRVIDVIDGDAFNTETSAELAVLDGVIQSDPAHDILKIIVVERYGRTGNLGAGFARGFGLSRGALASSVSIPSNNIVAVGAADSEMWRAIERLKEIRGGFVVVADGRVLAEVSLTIGGIMAAQPFESLVSQIEEGQAVARSLGCNLLHPFFTLAQTVLSTLPDLGLTDKGLIDVRRGVTTPVILEEVVA